MSEAQLPSKPPEVTPVVVLGRTPPRPEAIDLLDGISYLMDRCFEVPGSNARFGLNSLLLLLPGLGDVIAGGVSAFILLIALTHYRVPRIVAVRMVLNTLVDSTVSAIPVVGNLWDVWFKADTRNVNLLKQYVGTGEPPGTWKHWAFVVGTVLAFVTLLALIVGGTAWAIAAIVSALRGA